MVPHRGGVKPDQIDCGLRTKVKVCFVLEGGRPPRRNPVIVEAVALLTERGIETIVRYPDEELVRLDCVSLHTDHRNLTAAQAHEIKRAGKWLFCFTVNAPEQARTLFSWGVDAICTDAIDRIPANLAPTNPAAAYR